MKDLLNMQLALTLIYTQYFGFVTLTLTIGLRKNYFCLTQQPVSDPSGLCLQVIHVFDNSGVCFCHVKLQHWLYCHPFPQFVTLLSTVIMVNIVELNPYIVLRLNQILPRMRPGELL